MRSNRSDLVGLITGAISRTGEYGGVHGLPDMFLIKGIQQKIREAGKTLMIADTDNRYEQIDPLVRTFMEHRAEGILYVTESHREIVLPEMPNRCPMVLVNCFDAAGTPSVLPDDERGQYDLVRNIIRHGRLGANRYHRLCQRQRTFDCGSVEIIIVSRPADGHLLWQR